MDEPTNDLDMDTLDLLQEMLSDYEGTLLLVSHDRDFLDRVVTSSIVMEGDGTAIEYAGGYSDYIAQRRLSRAEAAKEEKAAAKQVKKAAQASAPKSKPTGKLSYKDQREYDNLPAAMAKLEAEIATLEDALSDSSLFTKDPNGFQKKVDRLDAARSELEASEERWLELEMLREELGQG